MNAIKIGDTVRVGKSGKVQYQVIDITDKGVYVSSGKSNRTVASETLTLVKSAPEPLTGMAELIIPDQTPAGTEPVSDEAWGNGPDVEPVRDPIMPVRESMFSDVDEPDKNDHRESVYGRTILAALNRLGKHVYGGTVTTKRRNKTWKASEKARRRQVRDERRAAYKASKTVI
jgi:hypothetical protein